MKIYIRSTRNNETTYTSHSGMDVSTIQQLLTDLGHSNIVEITEIEFLTGTNQI